MAEEKEQAIAERLADLLEEAQRQGLVEVGQVPTVPQAGYGRSEGYDGADDVRLPSEIGPAAGSLEAVNLQLLLERLEALSAAEDDVQPRMDRTEGMGY